MMNTEVPSLFPLQVPPPPGIVSFLEAQYNFPFFITQRTIYSVITKKDGGGDSKAPPGWQRRLVGVEVQHVQGEGTKIQTYCINSSTESYETVDPLSSHQGFDRDTQQVEIVANTYHLGLSRLVFQYWPDGPIIPTDKWTFSNPDNDMNKVVVLGDIDSRKVTIVVLTTSIEQGLYMLRPQTLLWETIQYPDDVTILDDIVCHQGNLYAIDPDGRGFCMEVNEGLPSLQWSRIASSPHTLSPQPDGSRKRLVEASGELYMLVPIQVEPQPLHSIDVFKLVPSEDDRYAWLQVKSMGSYQDFFVGKDFSFCSVASDVFNKYNNEWGRYTSNAIFVSEAFSFAWYYNDGQTTDLSLWFKLERKDFVRSPPKKAYGVIRFFLKPCALSSSGEPNYLSDEIEEYVLY